MVRPKNAKEVFESLIPRRAVRIACAKRLVQSIKRANRQAPGGWVVTANSKQIRLNVGRVLALQISSDEMSVYIHKPRGRPIYKAVNTPSAIVDLAAGTVSSPRIKFWKSHESFIDLAAKTQIRSAWMNSYSEDIIKYLERLLRIRLPRPSYVSDNDHRASQARPLHIVIGGVDNGDRNRLDKSTKQTRFQNWVAPKSVQAGDEAVIFVVGAGFYATGLFLTNAKPRPDWPNRYGASIGSVRLLGQPVSLAEIRKKVPQLKWAVYPRSIYTATAELAESIRSIVRDRLAAEAVSTDVPVSASQWTEIEEIQKNRKIGPRTKKRLIDARLGQGQFRDDLIRLWQRCAVTRCPTIEVLRASHIKPWKVANEREKLDAYNGLLLMPNLDALFDQALITFSEQGKIKIARCICKSDWKIWGLSSELRVKIRPKHQPYLSYHRRLFDQKQNER